MSQIQWIYSIDCVTDRKQFIGERNDCSVVAISLAFNISYSEAHDFCRRRGRQWGQGMDVYNSLEDTVLGKTLKKTQLPYYNHECRQTHVAYGHGYKYINISYLPRLTVKQFLKENKVGSFLIGIQGHIFTIKDGICYDYKNPQWCEIKYIIEIYENIQSNN